jgi:hypothetical protein
MSKGVFLTVQRCCQKAYVKVYCKDADEATVTADLHTVLEAQGVLRLHFSRGVDPAATVVIGLFTLRHGSQDLTEAAAQLTALGYEAF